MLAAPVSIEARVPIFLQSETESGVDTNSKSKQHFEAGEHRTAGTTGSSSVGPCVDDSRQGGSSLSALQRGLQETSTAVSVGAAGAADSKTPRVMKDEILSNQPSAAAPAPGSDSVGGWQPVPESTVEAPARPSEEHGLPLETSQLDPRAPVRKGKWTPEEERYTTRIINDFNKGLLPLAPGTTLRSYLSEKLNCDPMRITKKFAGASCIGKRVFMPVERTPENMLETHRSRRDLEEMARKFHVRLESMRPGGGGRSSSGASSKSSSGGAHSSPKTRRSTAQAAGTGGGGGAACGTNSGQGGGSARRGDTAPSHSGGGAGGGGERTASRSPSPGAHGPHSACDDSAPHPEGSPSHRHSSSWGGDDADGEGYGHYDPMDQSPSGDSDASSSSSSRIMGYPGNHSSVGEPGYGAAAAAAAAAATAYGAHGARGSGEMRVGDGDRHIVGYARCRCDACLEGGGPGRRGGGGVGGHGDIHTSYGSQHQQEEPHHQKQQLQQQGPDGFHRHGSRRPYNFHVGAIGGGGGETEDTDEGGGDGEPGGGSTAGRMSPRSPTTRVSAWGGRASPTAHLGPVGAPRTLPPSALAAAIMRDGPGGGSGARSPTWPLPRVIPEGSEISDQDAGGLLIGFFQKVHEKAQTAADELGEGSSSATDEGASPRTTALHPLMASKRGCRSISSPALTQFAHYAEQLPRMQTPTFKRRKSVSSFV